MRRRPRSPLSRLVSIIGIVLMVGAIGLAIGELGAAIALKKAHGNRADSSVTGTVAAGSYRPNGHGPLDFATPGAKVFVFGGTAVLGAAVAEGETIPAALGDVLRDGGKSTVQVFNFGGAGWHSSRERRLLERFLTDGVKPDLAIFIDGFDDLADCVAAPEEGKHRSLGDRLAGHSNLVALVHHWRGRAFGEPTGFCTGEADLDRVILRLDTNRRIVAAMAEKLGFKALFVTQPLPSSGSYSRLAEARSAGRLYEPDHLWLADLRPADGGAEAAPPTDSPQFNRAIGEAIAQRVLSGNLLP